MHDMGSEFCNNLANQLHQVHGVDIRITSAGRPQPNGQAESTVRNVKAKMEAFMVEVCNKFLPHHIINSPRIHNVYFPP